MMSASQFLLKLTKEEIWMFLNEIDQYGIYKFN